MSDTEKDRKDVGKKKEGKKDKKEKGYTMFDEDNSDEGLMAQEDLKSPTKMKKAKAFRFGPKKDIFPKTKEEKKEKEGKKEEKEKKEGKKHKLKGKSKKKHHDIPKVNVPETYDKPVFGVPLSVALERNRSHDGIALPALFRECIDYIEEHGLHCEGIYRISGVKSKVQHLKDSYNRCERVYLEEHEPNIVAGVLKQFLRELPNPILTDALMPKFEEASTIRNERRRIEGFHKLIQQLPESNRLLLSWMIVHMTHVIERQKENKMTLQNVSIVLSPTMKISHRVLNVLFSHTRQLFKNTVLKRYVPPLKPASSRWSLDLSDNPQVLQEELGKQESLLNQLHEELAAGEGDTEKEEQIWEVQRVCTQLKRKIKEAQKNQDLLEKRRRERDEQKKRNTLLEEGEEELQLELQELPDQEVLKLELQKPPGDVRQSDDIAKGQPEVIDKDQREPVANDDDLATDAGENTQTIATEAERTSQEQRGVTLKELANQSKSKKTGSQADVSANQDAEHKDASAAVSIDKTAAIDEDTTVVKEQGDNKVEKNTIEVTAVIENVDETAGENVSDGGDKHSGTVESVSDHGRESIGTVNEAEDKKTGQVKESKGDESHVSADIKSEADVDGADTDGVRPEAGEAKGSADDVSGRHDDVSGRGDGIQPGQEGPAAVDEEGEKAEAGQEEDTHGLTAEEVRADLKQKQALMLQEDTTDSELGRSQESIQQPGESEDEFEHSLDEILEREGTLEGDNTDHEMTEERADDATSESVTQNSEADVSMETKTPVPVETPESPVATTPVPQQMDEVPEPVRMIGEDVTVESEDTNNKSDVKVESGEGEVKSREGKVDSGEVKVESEVSEDELFDDEEYQLLLEEEYALKLAEEELLAIESELRKKIETERCEKDRLQQEIDELQYLRQDSDEEVMSSSSDSSYESDNEEDLQEILNQFIKENEELERSNSEMCSKIHDERMQCLDVKVQIGLIQQKQAQSSVGSDALLEKDMLIEFD